MTKEESDIIANKNDKTILNQSLHANHEKEYWTKGALKDELTFVLSTCARYEVNPTTNEIKIDYKYHDYSRRHLFLLI